MWLFLNGKEKNISIFGRYAQLHETNNKWCYTITGENQFKAKIRPIDFNIMGCFKKQAYWYDFTFHIAIKL